MILLYKYVQKQRAQARERKSRETPAGVGAEKNVGPSSARPYRQQDQTSEPRSSESQTVVGAGDVRGGTGTPSPTPEEAAFLSEKGGLTWEKVKTKAFWLQKGVIIRLVVLALSIAAAVAIGLEKNNIVHGLEPVSNKIKNLPAGFLIPIAILIVISFPPLFGHELIILLIGIIYGLGVGFGIVAAGTLIGEIANFVVFRYACRARAQKQEAKSLKFASFAELVRRGGFKVILAFRLSLLPAHFTTTIFATCRISFLVFIAAAVLALPKQLALVYIGVAYKQSGAGHATKLSKIISTVILVVTGLITYIALRYIHAKLAQIKPEVVYMRRKARQTKLAKTADNSPQSSVDGVCAPQPRPAADAAGMAEEGRYGSRGPVNKAGLGPEFVSHRDGPANGQDFYHHTGADAWRAGQA